MSLLKNVKSSTGLIFLSCILCAGLVYANANPSENDDNYAADNEVNKPFSLIVIDPGHGGDKPGARGRISAEKDV
ncbi:N-acetylmuramoyl-L-alanine amidase, partial [Brucella sp. 21LCYQ03]|nr:N-acetylmuramoyl-L-alanine amidase [Brucella sp. 21LCYQ03]